MKGGIYLMTEVICGIYEIFNIINNKRYIGQSVNIYKRWNSHVSELNKNSHKNLYLQRAWSKYGEDNFRFSILEKCDAKYLDERENYYIEKYSTMDELFGYNLTSGGNSKKIVSQQSVDKMIDSRWTNEKREQQSMAISGNNNPMFAKFGSKNAESKPVLCVNTGIIFESMKLAAKWCGLKNSPMIGEVCRGKRKSAGKHPVSGEKLKWEFVNKEDKYCHSPRLDCHLSEEQKRALSEANRNKEPCNKIKRKVYCLELNVEFDNPTCAAKELNLKVYGIIECCKGNRQTCGGYHWMYTDQIANHNKINDLAM